MNWICSWDGQHDDLIPSHCMDHPVLLSHRDRRGQEKEGAMEDVAGVGININAAGNNYECSLTEWTGSSLNPPCRGASELTDTLKVKVLCYEHGRLIRFGILERSPPACICLFTSTYVFPPRAQGITSGPRGGKYTHRWVSQFLSIVLSKITGGGALSWWSMGMGAGSPLLASPFPPQHIEAIV
jgi:hypothetical protein